MPQRVTLRPPFSFPILCRNKWQEFWGKVWITQAQAYRPINNKLSPTTKLIPLIISKYDTEEDIVPEDPNTTSVNKDSLWGKKVYVIFYMSKTKQMRLSKFFMI